MRWNKALIALFFGAMFMITLLPAETQAQEQHTPVVEYFGYIGCSFCVYAEDAIPAVEGATDAIILEYHIWSDQAGWQTQEGTDLASQYGITGTPAVVVDGMIKLAGADPSGYGYGRFQESCEDAYIGAIQERPATSLATISPVFERDGDNFVLNATISIDQTLENNLALRLVVYERTATYEGHSYRNVVREVLQGQEISSPGQHNVSRTFNKPLKTQNTSYLAAAVILYDTSTGEVYQSASVFLDPTSQTDLFPSVEGDSGIMTPLNAVLLGVFVVLGIILIIRWRKV